MEVDIIGGSFNRNIKRPMRGPLYGRAHISPKVWYGPVHTQFIGEILDIKADEGVLDEKGMLDIENVLLGHLLGISAYKNESGLSVHIFASRTGENF